MVKRFHVKLIKVELKKNDYDLVNFELIYHLVVDYEFCYWNVSKLKSDFLKLNQALPESFPGDISLTFPFWGIRPTDARLAKHEELVGQYVSFLGTLTSHSVINDFLETRKHDVLCVALDVLKEHRGSNESEIEVWDMLNSCDEDLILTEKQLHSINSCTTPSDLQIPFLELRRALENVENVKVIGNGNEECHKYKPSPNLDMSHFQSLTSLTLVNVDFKGVSELGNLSETLQHLTIKAGIQEIKDILIWVNENDREPVAWNSLESLNLSYNSIETMDESLQLVIQLTTLNLSFNKILSINSIQGLPYLRELDLSHNNIIETGALHLKMGNITQLNLSHNRIKLLYGFERMFCLEDLNLSYNSINQLNELNRLAGLPQLEHLSLSGNAIARKSSYRADVLALFYEKPTFRLDKEAISPVEFRKLQKILEMRKEVEVRLEESICVVDISLSEESTELGEDSLTFSDINLNETHFPCKRPRLTTMASISEVEESIDDDDTLENGSLSRERTSKIVEVEKMVRLDGDNWLASFMDSNEIFVKPATPPEVLKVTEETLKRLDSGQLKQKKKQTVADGTESYTTESSRESKDSKNTHSPKSNDGVIRQKSEGIPFHIVPNEVYNIDEKIEDLVCRYSSLSFSDLQTNYSVYRDDQFFVMGLVPTSKPFKPELVEIQPKGGKITWSLFPSDIESCSLIGEQICIKKFGDEAPRTYSQLFLHDMAHLYLLLTKMKDIRESEPSEELCKRASNRILLSALDEDLNEDFYTFPSHCFRYCKADVSLPVVVAITDSEVFIIKIDSHDLLNLNQDMLSQILANDSCQVSVLHREKISNLRQILRSFFQHTVRIEFKEENNPFGSPETTFSLLGFNSSDIDTFIESVTKLLDSQNISPTEVIITEQENDLRSLKRVLRIQDLQQINCISIRLESCYFRCLVMTENFLHILEEDFVRWPPPCFVRHPPLTPRYSIVQQIRIRFLFGITIYSEIYHGSYVLTLDYYTSLKSFERGRSDIFISSFENREQIVGHIKRTWRQYYKKEITVSNMKRYEVELEVELEVEGGRNNGMQNGTEFTVENFSNISMDKVQRYVGEVLNDSYNILYLTKTYCLSSHSPDTEYRCIVIITAETIHVLISLPPRTPAKVGSVGQDNRVSDHLGLLLSHPVTDISQIVCGFFEQKIRFEFGYNELGLVTFMTRNVETSRDLHRAVVESLHCEYQTDTYESDNVLITKKGRELSITHLDEDRLDELRFTIAKHGGIPDYNEVQILSYYLFYQVVGDSKDLITVVLAHQSLYLIQEDNIFWPLPQSNQHRMPNTVQFKIVESIPLEDIMCVHYTHFTSCDVVILYENSELHNEESCNRRTSLAEQEFYLIEAVEKLGRTATLHTTSYQQRDHLIRTLCHLRSDELPVKKLGT